jgi:glycosyltransferase involved in cell wall biosynthesis
VKIAVNALSNTKQSSQVVLLDPDQLTVMIITFNEEANIGRTLDSLRWAPSILVIDSYSTDSTLAVVQAHPNTRVLQRKFQNFADQCNFGLGEVDTPWVLSIDADYVFPQESAQAIEAAIRGHAAAYRAMFRYCVYGQPVRGSIRPPRTVLYRKAHAHYVNDGHGHRVVVEGAVESLPFSIRHDDRKPLSRWLQSQINYARQEADKISSSPGAVLGRNDRIRKAIVLAPALVFLLVYLLRGAFVSGWRGLFYALQRLTFEVLLSLYLIDVKLQSLLQTSDTKEPE